MASRLTSLALHRETVRLVLLCAFAIVSFLLTTTLAANLRAVDRDDAAQFFARAEQARAAGHLEEATAALRRAVSLRPNETRYVLALAAALTDAQQYDAAMRALMRVRAEAPDDAAINRAIAQIAARRHDIATAVRYYHNALYGPWPSAAGPRAVRLELIRFLLDNGDTRRAVSELIAATTDLPDTADAHRQLAQLFAEAGEPAHAFELFSSALKLSPHDRVALEGAIAMAFALGDYATVAAYTLPADAGAETRERVMLSQLVIDHDPLLPRLGAASRRRRLASLESRVSDRAAACGETATGAAPAPDRRAGRAAAAAPVDTDTITDALESLARTNASLDARCPSTPLDRAIELIAHSHGIDPS